jgi:membrane protein
MKNKGRAKKEESRTRLRVIREIFRETLSRWIQDNAPHLAAAIAFYTVFSIAPIIILIISVTGLVFGEHAARGEIVNQIQNWTGPNGALLIQTIIRNASGLGVTATLFAVVFLVVGATAVFVELRGSLNVIWRVSDKTASGIKGFVKARIVSFLMILILGALLMISILLGMALSLAMNFFTEILGNSHIFWWTGDILISVAIAVLLFATIYKILPDTEVEWGDVWIGAVITSILFTIGKYLIGLYLARSMVASIYGAAGSLAIFLLWVYYSAQIFLFGAELTAVYARRYGSRTRESKGKGGIIRLSFSPSSPR